MSHFYINLNISFISKDIFTKFTGNVYSYKPVCGKFWPHFEKQIGHHSQLYENHNRALNLEILQLASLNVIILLKRPYISLIIDTEVPNVKTTYRKSWPETLFQLLTFNFDLFFNVKWGYLHTKTLYLIQFSIITDPKAGDNCCGSGFVLLINGTELSCFNTFLLHFPSPRPYFSCPFT